MKTLYFIRTQFERFEDPINTIGRIEIEKLQKAILDFSNDSEEFFEEETDQLMIDFMNAVCWSGKEDKFVSILKGVAVSLTEEEFTLTVGSNKEEVLGLHFEIKIEEW